MKLPSVVLVVAVAMTGCKGDKGDPGAEGPTGPAGPQGATGQQGPPGTFSGTFSGDATINGNLTVTGAITSDQSWVLLHSATLASAADYTIGGLDGDAYSRFRIEAEGIIFVGGSDKAIGIRPNGNTIASSYVMVMSYDQHTPGVSATTAVTGAYGLAAGNQLPLCAANWNTDCHLTCTGELRTKSGGFRAIISEAAAETIITTCGTSGTGCISRQRHGGAWRNTAANITSLVFTFNGATGFNGTLRLYGRK